MSLGKRHVCICHQHVRISAKCQVIDIDVINQYTIFVLVLVPAFLSNLECCVDILSPPFIQSIHSSYNNLISITAHGVQSASIIRQHTRADFEE